MIVDNSPIDRAIAEFKDALETLPVAERSAQRLKFLAMFDECPRHLFVIKAELTGTGPTYDIERSSLHPSEFYLGWIAAIRAGNLNWNIELAD